MSCEQLHLLGPLVDGELSPDRAQSVSLHAASCSACSAELDELRAMNRLLSAARQGDLGRMPEEAMGRLRLHVEGLIESADVGLIWMARIFSGVAASVLIAGLWLLNQPVQKTVASAPARDHMAMTAAYTLTVDPPRPVTAPDLRSPESILDDLAGTNLSSAANVTEAELP